MRKINIFIMLSLLMVMFFSTLSGCKDDTADLLLELDLEYTIEMETEYISLEDANVFVYVCGAVVSPGVYELLSTSRVFEAIELAGGVTEDAAVEYISMARIVRDEERIYIPTLEEVERGEYPMDLPNNGGNSTNGESSKVNINEADAERLMTLTGIGPSKARSIIDYREQVGPFNQIEDIMNVSGIGTATFEKIKNDITH